MCVCCGDDDTLGRDKTVTFKMAENVALNVWPENFSLNDLRQRLQENLDRRIGACAVEIVPMQCHGYVIHRTAEQPWRPRKRHET